MSAPTRRGYDRAAVVILAHNERSDLSACLRAVVTAALCAPIPVTIVVVLDTTDADSQVDPAWLVHQLELDVDMVLGVVRAADSRHHSADVVDRYARAYDAAHGGIVGSHRHIHGAKHGLQCLDLLAGWRLSRAALRTKMSTW